MRPARRGQGRSLGLRAALIGSASGLALFACETRPARAADPIFIVNTAANGVDATHIFPVSWNYATAGGAAAPVILVNGGAIEGGVLFTAIELGSVGGKGGHGLSGLLSDAPGAPGGSAGSVSLVQSGAITGGADAARPNALVLLYSRGGDGAYGYGGMGAGGAAGAVTLDLGNVVTASGTFTAGVSMDSRGGHAGVVPGGGGQGGTTEGRTALDGGAAGGMVSAAILPTGAIITSGAQAPALTALSIGGNGGSADGGAGRRFPSNGGGGGPVIIGNAGRIATYGAASAGISAQSVGGIGGDSGGSSFSNPTPGGRGGDGGTVTVTNAPSGLITTDGAYSFGILAQSVSGAGGRGAGGSFTSGSSGGDAGGGGRVSVTQSGLVETLGTGAIGILAQSVGGGNALDAFQASAPAVASSGGGAGGQSCAFWWCDGGRGGAGGAGGSVEVINEKLISTFGQGAYGILAQSIGGGGGTGGVSATSGAFLAIALGGGGGAGGSGRDVKVTVAPAGSIATSGDNATAILAQSIGGGGGAGGYASAQSVGYGLSASSAVGGSGGGGGVGGGVRVENSGRLQTDGDAAFGIQAVSIGGGGGVGGGANAFAVALPAVLPNGKPLPSVTVTKAVGGSGGLGGRGGAVRVINNGSVTTFGDEATAIQGQSIGGGGGNAGASSAYGLAIAAPGATALNWTTAVGGSGGGGGSSWNVVITNSGSLTTYGDRAMGIQAQGIGGGGGNSGAASATADALSLYRTVALGETIGGSNKVGGGAGGVVTVENFGRIETWGASSAGIFAQSIGGGGGNGGGVDVSAASGLSFDKTLNSLVQKLPLANSLTITAAIGGQGGIGGNGEKVTVTNGARATIVTDGTQAHGVFAQSIGGGGGSGGGSAARTDGTLALKLTIGGAGGVGGKGGGVEVTNRGSIATYGDGAHGVFGQSIGGGGGAGGDVTADARKTPDRVGQIFAALKEAVGVAAYNRWAADKGNAETKEQLEAFLKDVEDSSQYKYLSDAFTNSDFYKQLQSFGSSVGTYLDQQKKGSVKRPDVSLTLALGGDGGSGNVGGAVTLTNSGDVSTFGDVSHAMFGQSVGGGGGQGGLSYASGTNKTNVSATFGGHGGDGNVGGTVTLTNEGRIWTEGESAFGLFGQSVGGGGGTGVGATSGDNKNLVINLTIGGDGGKAADGGAVTLSNSGKIDTFGKEAHGIVAQSVGGGGGAFVMNPENAAKTRDAAGEGAEAAASDSAVTALLKAVGIEAVAPAAETSDEAPKKSGSLTLGGSGGGSGAGGAVTVNHSGLIVTSGEAAFGILAQSVGGGGGLSNAAGSPGGVKYAAAYGGSGGAAGQGGRVAVTFTGDAVIQTLGDHAMGVFAQSVGGGGGYGGASVLQGWTLPVLGGEGGSSGNGGVVSVSNVTGGSYTGTLSVFTSGAGAHGVFAQSLGGGGGTVSQMLNTDTTVRATLEQLSAVLNAAVALGDGGGKVLDYVDRVPEQLQNVVRLLGNDTTTVNAAVARLTALLDRRSASAGTGGDIDISLRGTISASGANAYGLFAQSGFQDLSGNLDPTRVGGDIRIQYSGTLTGGSGTGAAIGIDGGRNNTISIAPGAIVSAASGTAVRATFGNDTIINSGLLIGDIDLTLNGGGRDTNAVTTSSSGTYRSNANGLVTLGSRGRFWNEGIFDIAGQKQIGTATISAGEFRQLGGGTILVDVTSTPGQGQARSDLLSVDTAILYSRMKVNVVGGLRPEEFRVITAGNSMSSQLTSAGPSPVPFGWSTRMAERQIFIAPQANFAPVSGLTATTSEQSIMRYLQNAWNAGGATINDKMAGLFGSFARVTSAQQYMQGIDSLVPEESASTLTTQTLNARASMNAALSCPVFEGSGTLMQETDCAWARVIGSWIDQTSSAEASGYTQNAITYRVGAQREVMDNWFVGATAGFSQSWLNSSDGYSSTEGNGADAAVSIKHQIGPWLFAVSGHLGFGSYETNRTIDVGDELDLAEGTANVLTAGGRFRASYEFAFRDWYVRPYADLDLIYTYMPAYREQGFGTLLDFSSAAQTNFAFSPNVEIGGRFDLSPHLWLRPYGTIGMTFFAKDAMPIGVSLVDANDAIADFTTNVTIPATLVNLSAGVQLFDTKGYEIRAEYKADIGNDYLAQELSARFAVRF